MMLGIAARTCVVWFIELCIPSMTEHEYPRRNLLIGLKSLRRFSRRP
jgi:hypothetical protein